MVNPMRITEAERRLIEALLSQPRGVSFCAERIGDGRHVKLSSAHFYNISRWLIRFGVISKPKQGEFALNDNARNLLKMALKSSRWPEITEFLAITPSIADQSETEKE